MTDGDEEPEDTETEEPGRDWPVRGPATAQQAILAIGFIFFVGVVVGFVLCRTF